ncbi:GDP-mannose 4,6-dehydratase [Clostridium estertheticum]|uniref:GDP-mannose 4,6-dehydratase n=1 Tax=Clostridium estertheticum TaxID=238834 RepID=UPI001CF27F67|nr:GDP-mannose 4,6-dehydratase [Clostridium estertheticum]MCB2308284.1 GDP-mannose 4,6-dehydratase [Clostridium estertheticum]MCB2346408.1 GDP-mannose 4,6-dehydratase [Clostridium estertheticum]MCB2350821.1 GDP-mannose 4,6-dehydratase [Clostridium estertheticum]WAG44821.1 GDP-mannose 4,6-dehydratase [Clostridium estertheticum]
MNNSILVTGGAGFIGSNLCDYLLKNNNKIIIVDNFNDFYNPLIKRNNITKIQNLMKINNITDDNLIIKEGDIRDTIFLTKIFSLYKIDIVVHLAAMAGVRPSIINPFLYNEVNMTGTLNLLDLCNKYRINKFIFASSSSVYGNNEKLPFTESDSVDSPISPYGATKKSGELLCHVYSHLYEFNIACLRFFTVYGPRQRPDLAIYKFTESILKGKEISIFGDGTTQRDYTYIDDIVQGIDKAITWTTTDKNKYEIFNLGTSNTIMLKYMIERIEIELGTKAITKYLPMQPGDVNITYANISKSKEILGYNPIINFDYGIHKFVKWFKTIPLY